MDRGLLTRRDVGYHTASAVLLFLAALPFLAGCGSNLFAYRAADLEQYNIEKVAVFPMHNKAGYLEAGSIATNALITALSNYTDYTIEFEGLSFLIRERIIIRGDVDLETLRRIHHQLGVDAVMIGDIEEYEVIKGRKRQIPVVSMSLRMLEARSGRILYMGHLRKRGDDSELVLGFGRVNSPGELTRRITAELVKRIPEKR